MGHPGPWPLHEMTHLVMTSRRVLLRFQAGCGNCMRWYPPDVAMRCFQLFRRLPAPYPVPRSLCIGAKRKRAARIPRDKFYLLITADVQEHHRPRSSSPPRISPTPPLYRYVPAAKPTEAEQIRAKISGRSFHDILLYNHAPHIEGGLDGIERLHRLLMKLGMSFSVFQIVLLGLIIITRAQCWSDAGTLSASRSSMHYTCQRDSMQEIALEAAIYLCLAGFMMSTAATSISFIAVEYINGMRKESPLFIATGVLKYKAFFRASEALLWVDVHCWCVALNLASHAWLRPALAASFNIISFVLVVILLYTHWYVIVRKQQYFVSTGEEEGAAHQAGDALSRTGELRTLTRGLYTKGQASQV